MSAIAPITIADGQATPVNHIFNPVQTLEPVTFARNGDTSVPVVAQEQILASLKLAGRSSDAVNRAKLTLHIPVLEVPAGGTPQGYVAPPRVAYYNEVKIEFLLHNRSTAAQRTDLRVLAKNLLSNAQVVALVDTLEKMY